MDYAAAFNNGMTFHEFVEEAQTDQEMWRALAARAPRADGAAVRIAALPGRWRMLVLAEDWCGDALNTLPVIAGLAQEAGNVDLRIVRRDEHPELMARHLTNGGRSIPVAIVLDGDGRPRGWWGPRPRALQEWFEREGRRLSKEDRYRELRRWYARDRGASTAAEIADLIECGAAAAGTPYAGTRPCDDLRTA